MSDGGRKQTSETEALLKEVERLHAELERRDQAHDQLRQIAENFRDIPYAADIEGNLYYVGEQFRRYGYAPEDVIEGSVFDIIVPEDRERVLADLQRTMTSGDEFPTQFRILARDGTVHWVEDHGRLVRDEDGNLSGLMGVLRDISARKEAELALHESEERFRAMAESSFDAIYVADEDRRFAYLSPSVERIFGWDRDRLIGRSVFDVAPAEVRTKVEEASRRARQGGVIEGLQVRLRHRNGAPVDVELNAAPLDRNGKIVGVVGVVRDLGPRRAFEEWLREMQKMEAIGALASGIAHDFNNLLTGILGHADTLAQASNGDPEVRHAADVIAKAARRGSELTRSLVGFAQQGKLEERNLDAHAVIDEALELVGRSQGRHVRISKRFDAERAVVRGDAGQLEQVLVNLAVNACEAMPGRGDLEVSTALVQLPPSLASTLPGHRDGASFLRISVVDGGIGMSDDVRSRMFEPFFTTKSRGQAAGLGLAMVYGIIANHGGALDVTSAPGEGTRVDVYLPLSDARRPSVPELSATRDAAPAPAHVLVVDDEEVVRDVARVILERRGHRVSLATGGEEAVEILNRERADVALAVVDLTMPGMDGRECLRALREVKPGLTAILASGLPLDGLAADLQADGFHTILQKPFSAAELADAVARSLTATVSADKPSMV